MNRQTVNKFSAIFAMSLAVTILFGYFAPATCAAPQQPTDTPKITPPSRLITKPKSESNGGKNKKPRGAGSVWMSVGALLLIVVLIIVAAKLLKKHAPKLNGGIPEEAMELLGKRMLDQRQQVHLVRLGSRILVLGSNTQGQGLQPLTEITDPVEVDYLTGLCRKKQAMETPFAQGFLSFFRKSAEHETPESETFANEIAQAETAPEEYRFDAEEQQNAFHNEQNSRATVAEGTHG